VPDAVMGRLPELTSDRAQLADRRGRETQRIRRTFEDASIERAPVVSDRLAGPRDERLEP